MAVVFGFRVTAMLSLFAATVLQLTAGYRSSMHLSPEETNDATVRGASFARMKSAEEMADDRRFAAFGVMDQAPCPEPIMTDTSESALGVTASRLRTAATFAAKNLARYVEGSTGYEVSPIFDKSHKLNGQETYEDLVEMQIQGLSENDISAIEDKIVAKKTVESVGVTPTKYFYSAHKSEYNQTALRKALEGYLASGKTSYIVKPSHMAWSKGLLIVRDQDKTVDFVVKWVEDEVLSKQDESPDSAHLKSLEPGVLIEELFGAVPGQKPLVPLECKVQVVWGEVYLAWFVGQDPADGCKMHSDVAKFYGDGTGWGLSGSRQWVVDEGHQAKMITYAKKVARALKADVIRADFFLLPGLDDVYLNEFESVSGNPNFHERRSLGEAWRLGYIANGNFSLTPEKLEKNLARMHLDRKHLEA